MSHLVGTGLGGYVPMMRHHPGFLALVALVTVTLLALAGGRAVAHEMQGGYGQTAAPPARSVAALEQGTTRAPVSSLGVLAETAATALPDAAGDGPAPDACLEGCCNSVCHAIGLTSTLPVYGPSGLATRVAISAHSHDSEGPASVAKPPKVSV